MREISAEGLRSAAEYARKYDLHALLIEQAGTILHEEYGGGYDADRAHALYSGTKSFWGAVAAAALDDGLLTLDEPVSRTIDAWTGQAGKSQITIRQLLALTAGLPFGGLGNGVPSFEAAIAKPLANAPGTVFTYGGIPLQIFGAVMTHKLAAQGKTPLDYLQCRIFEPIGLETGSWRALKDGTHTMPTGCFLTARNWAKFGTLLSQHGTWNGRTLISQSSLEQCWIPGAINPRYGIGFWLLTLDGGQRIAYASGAGKQALYITLDSNIVVVHFSMSKNYQHERFLARLLTA
ncbi:MAG: beta-lactamase family protein [Candidatus Eremiobacteraeota bacterium]|nr:beta-lactamase family protein [Candidatus Eremiobacteraeota bacterium]